MRGTMKGKDFFGAVVVTVLVTAIMLVLTMVVLGAFWGGGAEEGAAGLILFAIALLYLAIAVGVIVALFQRWKEIQGGEEDEAKKY